MIKIKTKIDGEKGYFTVKKCEYKNTNAMELISLIMFLEAQLKEHGFKISEINEVKKELRKINKEEN